MAGLALCLCSPAQAGAARWSRPFRLAGPAGDEVVGSQLAVSSSGQAAVSFSVMDEDRPWISQAQLVLRSARGKLVRMGVPRAKAVLALAFEGGSLELLAGSAPARQPCCTAAHLLALQGPRLTEQQTVLSGLTGTALGALVALPGSRMLAAVATDRAVWAREVVSGPRPGALRRISQPALWPQALAAAGLPGGRYALAWSGAPGLTAGASSIAVARRGARRITIPVPAGYEVDEIALAPGKGGGTLAWVESWFDASGAYHSAVAVTDLTAAPRPRTYEIAGEIVGGLSLAANGAGDQVLAFRACDPFGSCSVLALSRPAGGDYGQPQELGAIDPGEQPVASVSGTGSALVGWVGGGHVEAAGRLSPRRGFSGPAILAGPGDASGLELSFGNGRRALAAWTQGTAAQSLMGAVLAP